MRKRLVAAAWAVFAFFVFSGSPLPASAGEEIKWMSLEAAKVEAQKTGKPIMISFYTTWCGYCKKLERETFREPAVIKTLNAYFLPVKLDGDDEAGLARKYLVRGFPTIVFVDAEGKTLLASPGYRPPEHFMGLLKYVHSGMYRKMTYDRFDEGGFAKHYNFPASK